MQTNRFWRGVKRLVAWGALIGIVLVLIAFWQFRGSAVATDYELRLSRKADYSALLDSLLPHIGHYAAFRFYADHLDLEHSFKPGLYRLTEGMDVIRIVRKIKLGDQEPVRLTINNVRIMPQLAGKLAGQIDADSLEILQVLTNRATAQRVGVDSLRLFSIFLPDSYEIYWTMTPDELVDRFKREYDRFWTAERDAKRTRSGLSRFEVMTLASIVYEETRQVDEMPRVAGVYVNRLKKGIPLQADPTVKYAMQDFQLRRILHKHLKYESPYNTYLHKGLPPSPICMPSKQAIDAVLNYEQHKYLFFCARPTFDGYHNFAVTFAEHKRNAQAYAAELNRRKIK